MKRFIILALLLCGQGAAATDRAITCHGCSSAGMSRTAAQATDRGTVYVFNAASADVRKYSVFTEVVDTQPYTIWKQAMEKSVEPELDSAYREYVESVRDIAGNGVYRLPADFPVRSVAGALLDPAFSTTSIEDYLSELLFVQQAELHLSTIAARLVRAGIKLLDVTAVIDKITLLIEFPDGTTQEYTLEYTINGVSLEPRAEVTPVGNARMANGQPAPTSRLGFDGHRFRDNGGSVREWAEWARMNGVSVRGGLSGSVMVCEVEGDEIRCTVRQQP
jgi:hypothetical protein